MKRLTSLTFAVATLVSPGFAAITLGTAETFAVLGASTVTNTGATQIRGNLGVGPGTSVVGFPPGEMALGTIYAGDAVAMKAQDDLTTAYKNAAALPCKFNLTGHDLGGRTLTPGVYCFNSSAQLTGALVLDFTDGDKSGFIFQIGSTLTTASHSIVSLTNCTKHCVILWQVGSSATLGTSTKFSGDIMAKASITLTTNVNLCGRALARTGAVTLDADIVDFMGSLTPPAPSMVTGNGQISVPRPNSDDPAATGPGKASFAFIADPSMQGSFFNYLNYVTGVRIYGPIDSVEIIATHQDGSPKTVRVSGACDGSLPACSFLSIVESPDTPGGAFQFGVTITGGMAEARSLRFTNTGQIQFH
jgi:hypothetical protein